MSLARFVSETATHRPRTVVGVIASVVLILALLAVLPSLWPERFASLHPVRVDTDPENMLSSEEPVRIYHNEMKSLFDLNDIIVVGVVNEHDPQGVFNPDSLRRIHELTKFAETLQGESIGSADPRAGVVRADIIAPSTVDNIEQGGVGTVRFEWLMQHPPQSREEALAIRDKALKIPFLSDTLVSRDGQAIALYLPITSKDLSYQIRDRLQEKIAEFDGDDQWHITGLPVANDVFGVEMFKQMAISAPLAMLVIFLLMLFFFRNPVLIVSPMLVAMASVIITMSLLVLTGNTIHIMSSMIPIFIMPIAVLDSIHILSEFFDHYQGSRNRVQTIKYTLKTLFRPMLYTSITSAAGFASLALTPIPPVQVFGLFVALGILVAWALTILLIPAYIMFIPERKLESFGLKAPESEGPPRTIMGRLLTFVGSSTYRRSKVYLGVTALLVVLSAYGITRIVINDNPTKWFKTNHSIRVADQVLNDHFGGTYMAYLSLEPKAESLSPDRYLEGFRSRLEAFVREDAFEKTTPELAGQLTSRVSELASEPGASRQSILQGSQAQLERQMATASEEEVYGWEELQLFLDRERTRDDAFKDPEVLRYIGSLEKALQDTGIVGKTNSLADIVKTVHRELFEGQQEAFRIPDSAGAVAQTLVTYQSSHRPQDLWHFVTPDYRKTSLWVQLKSGDNRDMTAVVEAAERFLRKNPPPLDLQAEWFGLTYINVIWQAKMVSGMLKAFLGSFLVVLLMMIFLFRSAWWGLLSMVPLTVTIGIIYGTIGLVGKNYDMPVAVLSSLTIGLAVDFAIHFLVRAKALYTDQGEWRKTVPHVFGEPARAITRNVVVVAVGFTPLLLAPLLPYVTVGIFMASIMLVSGAATLILLPSLIRSLEPLLFPATSKMESLGNRWTCFISGLAVLALLLVNVQQFFSPAWTTWAWIGLAALALISLFCAFMGSRAAWTTQKGERT